jgi:hypothetical protein
MKSQTFKPMIFSETLSDMTVNTAPHNAVHKNYQWHSLRPVYKKHFSRPKRHYIKLQPHNTANY